MSPEGRWLTYESDTAGRGDVYVASFPTLGRPTVLIEVDDVSNDYDVSLDGTKFLMLLRDATGAGTAPGQVNLVLNVVEQLKRIVPTK